MSLKNGNTVAVERRMDLASLFCMIGRHGPAVAVAVIAMVSVLAGFIIYRSVKGKRRKATADSDDKTPGAERDASVPPSPEEFHTHVEATDLSDDGSLDVKEDDDLTQNDHTIRRRFAAAAPAVKAPSSYYPPMMKDIQVPENQYTSSDDTVGMAFIEHSYRVAETCTEDASPSLLSSTDTEAEMVDEDSVYCYHITTNDITEDVMEEIHDIKCCLKEPDENHDEEEKVLMEEFQEAEVAIIDQDSSDRKTKQEDKTSHISENVDVKGVRANEFQVERNRMGSSLEEPLEDAPVPCICNIKDVELVEENIDNVAFSNIGSYHLSTEEEKKAECDVAEEECEDYWLIPQQAVIHSSTSEQEIHLPSIMQDQSDHAADEVVPLIQDHVEMSKEVTGKEQVNKHEQRSVDTDIPQFNENDGEIEQKKRNGFNCSQEDVVVHDSDDQMKGNRLENDAIAAHNDECETLIVENNPDLCCLGANITAETKSDGLSGAITDAKTDIETEDKILRLDTENKILRLDTEDKILRLDAEDKETDSSILGSQIPSHDACSEPENIENDTTMVLEKKCTGLVCAADVPSCPKDQQSVQKIQNEDMDKAGDNITFSITAVEVTLPHVSSNYREQKTVENIDNDFESVSAIADTLLSITAAKETPFPQLICQYQESNQIDDSPNLDVAEVTFASDTAVCNNVCPNTLLIAQEMTCSDMSSSPKDQQNDHGKSSETFDEVEVAAASTPACNAILIEPFLAAEKPHPVSMPPNQKHLGIDSENTETPDETRHTSVSDTFVCDKGSIASTTVSEETSHEDMMSFCHDGHSYSVKDNEDFPGMTTGVAPVAVDISSPMCPIYLPSFKQSELGDNDLSSPGLGKESGISSMAVSPDLQDARNAFDMTVENIVAPVRDCDLLFSGPTESRYSLFATDVAVAYSNENKAAMVFGPYPSQPPKPSHGHVEDWINSESFAANEDMFGHEIEDRYHREMDQFMAQIVDSVTCLADELKEETEMKAVEVVTIIEKKAEVGVEKKESKEEEDEAVDFEKTDISIMEATMDNNEWITDSNYPVLPWMNLSAPTIAQDHTKQNNMSTEESSAGTENTCLDTTDVPPATEVKQSCTLSPADENSENNKKVLAVQPMPQNVSVTFRVHYFPQSPYQTVAVTGNQQELGNWKEFIPLERAKDGNWAVVVSLPAESHVEWKFVLLDKGEVCRWEECGNRLLETGSGDDLLVHKWWGFL